MVTRYREQGMSLNGIAAKLNADSILTARGKRGAWTPTAVKNLLARLSQEGQAAIAIIVMQ